MAYALSIVMPAFNEEGNIERAVRSALEAGQDLSPPCEVVVVDDGSRDATGTILTRLETELGISVGTATEDGFFHLDAVRCLGCCGLSPVIMIDDETYGRVKPAKLHEILDIYREVEE